MQKEEWELPKSHIVKNTTQELRYTTYDRIWGKSSSILLPVFLKICNAASATFSSSIFKQARRDSKVSAEWNEIGCVNESTCQNKMKAMLVFLKAHLYRPFHQESFSTAILEYL